MIEVILFCSLQVQDSYQVCVNAYNWCLNHNYPNVECEYILSLPNEN